MATVALPAMSMHAARQNMSDLRETLSFSLRTVFFITIPSAIGLLVLARPITSILFERGQFDEYSTMITSLALFFYCFGLFAYAGIKILVSCFYSMQDTLTPVKVASACVALNFLLNIILMWPLKVGGLALATSISATCNFMLLLFILRKKIGRIDGKRILISVLKMLSSGIVMGVVCFFLYRQWLAPSLIGKSQEALRLFGIISISIVVYIFVSLLIGLEQPRQILKKLIKR